MDQAILAEEILQHSFLFVRHGRSKANATGMFGGATDVVLTPEGKEEALMSAQTLKAFSEQTGTTIDRIDNTGMLRTQETAEIITDALDASSSKSYPDLKERSWGIAECGQQPQGYGEDFVASLEEAGVNIGDIEPNTHDAESPEWAAHNKNIRDAIKRHAATYPDFALEGGESSREFNQRSNQALSEMLGGYGDAQQGLPVLVGHRGNIRALTEHYGYGLEVDNGGVYRFEPKNTRELDLGQDTFPWKITQLSLNPDGLLEEQRMSLKQNRRSETTAGRTTAI